MTEHEITVDVKVDTSPESIREILRRMKDRSWTKPVVRQAHIPFGTVMRRPDSGGGGFRYGMALGVADKVLDFDSGEHESGFAMMWDTFADTPK